MYFLIMGGWEDIGNPLSKDWVKWVTLTDRYKKQVPSKPLNRFGGNSISETLKKNFERKANNNRLTGILMFAKRKKTKRFY